MTKWLNGESASVFIKSPQLGPNYPKRQHSLSRILSCCRLPMMWSETLNIHYLLFVYSLLAHFKLFAFSGASQTKDRKSRRRSCSLEEATQSSFSDLYVGLTGGGLLSNLQVDELSRLHQGRSNVTQEINFENGDARPVLSRWQRAGLTEILK